MLTSSTQSRRLRFAYLIVCHSTLNGWLLTGHLAGIRIWKQEKWTLLVTAVWLVFVDGCIDTHIIKSFRILWILKKIIITWTMRQRSTCDCIVMCLTLRRVDYYYYMPKGVNLCVSSGYRRKWCSTRYWKKERRITVYMERVQSSTNLFSMMCYGLYEIYGYGRRFKCEHVIYSFWIHFVENALPTCWVLHVAI